jgi:hypothetical protein
MTTREEHVEEGAIDVQAAVVMKEAAYVVIFCRSATWLRPRFGSGGAHCGTGICQSAQLKNKNCVLLMEAGVGYNKQKLHKAGYYRDFQSMANLLSQPLSCVLWGMRARSGRVLRAPGQRSQPSANPRRGEPQRPPDLRLRPMRMRPRPDILRRSRDLPRQ